MLAAASSCKIQLVFKSTTEAKPLQMLMVVWVPEEQGSEAGADSVVSHLGSVARDKMVHGLLQSQTGDRWQHSEGVTAEEDQVLGVRAQAGHAGIVDVLQRV